MFLRFIRIVRYSYNSFICSLGQIPFSDKTQLMSSFYWRTSRIFPVFADKAILNTLCHQHSRYKFRNHKALWKAAVLIVRLVHISDKTFNSWIHSGVANNKPTEIYYCIPRTTFQDIVACTCSSSYSRGCSGVTVSLGSTSNTMRLCLKNKTKENNNKNH